MDLKDYIYDNGIARRYYVCSECGSKAMRSEGVDSCATTHYLCMECGSVEHKPNWELISEPIPEETPSEAWISMADLAVMVKDAFEMTN